MSARPVKSFTDETLPAGSSGVTYQITAVRSTARGNPARFTIHFGVGGDGKMVISLAAQGSPGTMYNVEIPSPSTKSRSTTGNGRPVMVGC